MFEINPRPTTSPNGSDPINVQMKIFSVMPAPDTNDGKISKI